MKLSLLINLQGLSKTYANQFSALKAIDLTIAEGELIAIVGASGSGKSTLMNIMGFLDRSTQGRYLFKDKDVTHLTDDKLAMIRNQKIGFVFQSFFLIPRLSSLQNVMLPLSYRNISTYDAERTSLAMLNKMGLKQFALQKPNQLSGGQQQRVAIARALVGNPEIIFADEPTGALDSETGKEILDVFLKLNQEEGRTIVLVTHDHAVSKKCQRVVHLKDGSII